MKALYLLFAFVLLPLQAAAQKPNALFMPIKAHPMSAFNRFDESIKDSLMKHDELYQKLDSAPDYRGYIIYDFAYEVKADSLPQAFKQDMDSTEIQGVLVEKNKNFIELAVHLQSKNSWIIYTQRWPHHMQEWFCVDMKLVDETEFWHKYQKEEMSD